MSLGSWNNLAVRPRRNIRWLDNHSDFGNDIIGNVRDGRRAIDVKSNSLGTIAWIFGLSYPDKSPNSSKGDSSYAVYRSDRPGFMPPYEFKKSLDNGFFSKLADTEVAKKGDIAIIKTPTEYEYYDVIDAGIFVVQHARGIDLFGQNAENNYFEKFTRDPYKIMQAGYELEYYKKK